MPEHSFHAISSSYKVKGKPQDAYLHILILQPFFSFIIVVYHRLGMIWPTKLCPSCKKRTESKERSMQGKLFHGKCPLHFL